MNSRKFFEYVASILGDMDKRSTYEVGYDNEYYIIKDGEHDFDYSDWFESITETDIMKYILKIKGIDATKLKDEVEEK